MSGVLANIGHFRRKVKTGQYKKLLKKKNKKKQNKTEKYPMAYIAFRPNTTLLVVVNI